MNLGKSEIIYKKLFETSPYYIILVDKDGKIIGCNPATENILGYSKEELVGKYYKNTMILTREIYNGLENKYKDLYKGKLFEPDELEVQRKDGKTIWVRSQIFLIKLGDEFVTQVIGQDISVTKEAELKLKESEAVSYTHLTLPTILLV